MVEPAEVTFAYDMSVTRIGERPRVTAPFSESAWNALDALGEKVDADLRASDVRLTMGGEPTFVSVDDYQSPEWNTDALGAMKRVRADDLIRRLRARFAPGGLLHYGQGKWYPGEPLPRWAFALYWRRDDVPIWRDDRLIVREAASRAASIEDAQQFAEGVAARAGIMADYVQPIYEDPVDRMLKQGLIPDNFDPSDPKIDDPHERARILKLFDQNIGAPKGFVLPLQRWTAQAKPGWLSEIWRTRRGRLFLVPGDSPLGFRLPLSSLPTSRSGCRLSASGAGRPVRRTPAFDRPAPHSSDPAAGVSWFGRSGGIAAAGAGHFGYAAARGRDNSARRIGHPGAHCALRRSARWPAWCLHAAG